MSLHTSFSRSLPLVLLGLVVFGCNADTGVQSKSSSFPSDIESSLRDSLGLSSSDELRIIRTGGAYSNIHDANIDFAWVYTHGSAGHRLRCAIRERRTEARWKVPDVSVGDSMGDEDPYHKEFLEEPSDEELEAFIAYCDRIPIFYLER